MAVITPNETHISGTFLLGKADLEQFGKLLQDSKKELDREVSKEIGRRVDKETKRWNIANDDEATRKAIRDEIRNTYPFDQRTQTATIHCEDGTSIKRATIAQLLEDENLGNAKPKRLSVDIQNGNERLSVHLLGKYIDKEEITVECSSEKPFAGRVVARLSAWAEENRRTEFWRRAAGALEFLAFVCFITCIPLFPVGTLEYSSSQSELQQSASKLIEGGIEPSEVTDALDLLLRNEFMPPDITTRWSLSTWYISLLTCTACLALLAWHRPRSILGLGKNKRAYQLRKWVATNVHSIAGAAIMAVITSTIGSYLYAALTQQH